MSRTFYKVTMGDIRMGTFEVFGYLYVSISKGNYIMFNDLSFMFLPLAKTLATRY